MDDQEIDDPIAEALSAVADQFAGERPPPDASAALDAAAYDEYDEGAAPDDPDADAAADDSPDDIDAEADTEAAPAVNWDDESNPYRAQAMQAQQRVQQVESAIDLVRRINAAKQAQQAEEEAQALTAQLQEIDPQLAEVYQGQRQGLIQTTQQAVQEKAAWTHSMAALVMAMNEVLGEEATARVREYGQELVKQPGLDQMQQFVSTKRQAAQSADKRVAELEEALRLALLQQGAKTRPAAADRVDSAPAARAKIARPEDADDMDGFFEAWTPQLNAHFGGGR